MRDQRETPRDILRALSRTLAPKSTAITTSSSSSPEDPNTTAPRTRGRSKSKRRKGPITIPEDPDDSDEFPIDRPRLSLPIDEDDASDDDLPRPPRMSVLDDLEDNYTMQSIEMARRQTINEKQRYSMRMSDYGTMNDPQSDNDQVGIDSAFFPRTDWDGDNSFGDDTGPSGAGDDATFERLDDDEAARRETLGRESFGAIDVNFDEADQSTVMLAPQMQSSPTRQEDLSSLRNEPLDQRESSSPRNEPLDQEAFSSPRNEPFDLGIDVEAPSIPEEMDVEDNSALPDIGADDNDIEMSDLESEVAAPATAKQTQSKSASKRLKKPGKKISKYGIEYPSLPPGVVKRVAQRFAGKSKISPDTLSALMQASDWFFEQLGDDLSAYTHHAGRKTIEESDMLTLMRRYVCPSCFSNLSILSGIMAPVVHVS